MEEPNVMRHSRSWTPKSRLLPVLMLAAVTLLATSGRAPAAENNGNEGKPPKLFSSNDTLRVTMVGPWRDIELNEKNQDPYPARIEYADPGGQAVSLEMTAERRGVKRQQICRFPPIKLRFEKDKVKGTTFRGQKSLKMVTYCNKSRRFDEYNRLEMLAYRMYNEMTDLSFRVRPLSVTWEDSETGNSYGPRFGFLLEDDSDVAKRNDLEKLRIARVRPGQFEPWLTSVFTLFQYMIGNVDWAALRGPDPEECCHNVQLLSAGPPAPDSPVYPVPYDFDSAGLVDARYAAPPESLPIRSVSQRLFRGFCIHNLTLADARKQFLEKENAIFTLLRNEQELNGRERRRAEDYLEAFFHTLKDDDEFRDEIIEKCRK
jgi:hypothetical protein